MTCRWCGKTLAEHGDSPGRLVPRMPCLGLKAHYLEEIEPGPEPVVESRRALLERLFRAVGASKAPLIGDVAKAYEAVREFDMKQPR